MSKRRRIGIVDWHEKRGFYEPLTRTYAADWVDIAPPTLAHNPPDVDLVLVNDETWPYCAAGLAEATRRGIPSLHLPDGICEWRNTWENPRPVPFMRPILASRVACLGAAQARLIESWGNQGKCEVTGSPRFDVLLGRQPRRRESGTRASILVVTARQPAFNEAQRACVLASLRDLREVFEQRRDWQPVWRLTAGLDAELGVADTMGKPLYEQLAEVDAVISTPSNVILESMAHGLPVAMLDYTNSPAYVNAAWSITAGAHIGAVLDGLAAPAANRMDWQRTLLRDQLACETAATPRVIALMERMMAGREAPAAALAEENGRYAELSAEIAHLRQALALRPSQILYRTLCEVKRRWGAGR